MGLNMTAAQRKPRRALDRCDFCGKRVAAEGALIRKTVDAVGHLSIHGIAHKACAVEVGKESAS